MSIEPLNDILLHLFYKSGGRAFLVYQHLMEIADYLAQMRVLSLMFFQLRIADLFLKLLFC